AAPWPRAELVDPWSRPCDFSSSDGARARGALFDALDNIRHADDALDKNARRMDRIGADFPCLNQMLDLGHRDLAGRCHHGIKIARRLAIDEIALSISLIGMHDRNIGGKPPFHDVSCAIELAKLLAFGNDRANAGPCEEGRNARAASPDPLGKS